MHARGVAAKWQSRRKISLGPVRRACPASGATWNVQVVRGKMTSRCLWHACRALALGLFLMLVGAGMATIGYYAEYILPHTETRNNSTVRVKSDSKGTHLHNLSYAGPIVMGCGGFIIVAACVMTFEARDSAAKVVPARFKLSSNTRGNGTRMNSSRRTTASGMSSNVGSQTRWDNQLGVFRTSPGENPAQSRVAQTAALVHFSRIIGAAHYSPKERRISRSGSVPNLTSCNRSPIIAKQNSISPTAHRIRQHHRTSKKDRLPRGIRGMQRNNMTKSIDEGGVYFTNTKLSIDSQNSTGDFSRNKRERTKRSDTAKKHILARQKQIDASEVHNSGATKTIPDTLRSNSTNSDISNIFRRGGKSTSVSRTPSVDSRGVQTDEILEKAIITSPPYRKTAALITQISTPSIEGKFKSQLSICSEPANVPIYQLSIDQSLIEEVPKVPQSPNSLNTTRTSTIISSTAATVATTSEKEQMEQEQRPTMDSKRPTTLDLPLVDAVVANSSYLKNESRSNQEKPTTVQNPKQLFRSNSSSIHKRQSTFVPAATTSANNKFKLSSELDQIFVISSNRANNTDDDNYDSIEVIDERRMKNMPKSDRARLYKSNTFICEEYYTNEQLACVMDANTKETIIEEKRE